jgi:asparagine synthase (glutamine-hydrolysing)
MGQLFVVHGPDAGATARAYARLLDALVRLGRPVHAGVREPLDFGVTRLGHAPCRLGAGVDGQRTAEGGGVVGIGAWLSRARHDAGALSALAPALLAGGAAWERETLSLDGAFVLAACDATGQRIVLATDRVGTQHAYHAQLDGCAVVAHSALLLAIATGARIDPLAAREFLAAGSVFEERSLYAGVRKLPPGARLRITPAGPVHAGRWWDPAAVYHGSDAARAEPGDVPALARALVEAAHAVRSCWPAAVYDLTGGFDSRATVAAALAAGHRPRTVVVGSDRDPDVVAAGRVAGELGLVLTQLRPGADGGPGSLEDLFDALLLTDGEADAVEYAGISAVQSRMAGGTGAEGATVNGTAGELCRGYWWDLLPSLGSPGRDFDARRAAKGRFATDTWADALTAGRHADSSLEHFTGVVARATEALRELPGVALADHIYLDLRMARWAGRLASATGRIWPCVSPFLFAGPMREALSAPPLLRRRDRMMRALIEHLHPRLAALPLAGGYPALPLRATTLHRFGPLGRELMGKVGRRLSRGRRGRGSGRDAGAPPGSHATFPALLRQPEVAACLAPETMASAPLYDSDALAAFLAERDTAGVVACKRLARVLTLELAARALDRAPPAAPAGLPARI